MPLIGKLHLAHIYMHTSTHMHLSLSLSLSAADSHMYIYVQMFAPVAILLGWCVRLSLLCASSHYADHSPPPPTCTGSHSQLNLPEVEIFKHGKLSAQVALPPASSSVQ